MKPDYCQYLLSSPVNYTVTNLGNHLRDIRHDRSNRYLVQDLITHKGTKTQKEHLSSVKSCPLSIQENNSTFSVYIF